MNIRTTCADPPTDPGAACTTWICGPRRTVVYSRGAALQVLNRGGGIVDILVVPDNPTVSTRFAAGSVSTTISGQVEARDWAWQFSSDATFQAPTAQTPTALTGNVGPTTWQDETARKRCDCRFQMVEHEVAARRRHVEDFERGTALLDVTEYLLWGPLISPSIAHTPLVI